MIVAMTGCGGRFIFFGQVAVFLPVWSVARQAEAAFGSGFRMVVFSCRVC